MNKLILSSLLFLLFLGIVSSKEFKVVMGGSNFKTTTDLLGIYSQRDPSRPHEGYHKAEVHFKTKISSFNPDQSGVNSIDCDKDKDGNNKITLSVNDNDAIETIKDWPEKVMLLISHKWVCFDKRTTQFFMVNNRKINEREKKVTFFSEGCEAQDWTDDYTIDLNWVNGEQISNSTRRELEKRFSIKKAFKKVTGFVKNAVDKVKGFVDKAIDRFGVPFPTITPKTKLSLNINRNGRRARKRLQLINDSGVSVACSNCFTAGDATIALRIAGKALPPKLDEASITLSGSFLMNIDVEIKAQAGQGIKLDDVKLLSFGLGPFNIPGVLNLGPSIDLIGSANVGASVAGTLGFGADLSLPDFRAKASIDGIPSIPKFEQSGFTPKVNPHLPSGDVEASIVISASLIPQVSFGISILNGRLLDERLGFEIVGTLENSLTFGAQNNCKRRTQPRLKSELGGSLGFFLSKEQFPIVEFPDLTLINRCLF